MTRGSYVFAALIVLVILVVGLTMLGGVASRSESSLSGFWAGEPAFLKGAGLKAMYFYVEDQAGDAGERNGHIVAVDNQGREVANRSFELNTGGRFSPGRLWRARHGVCGPHTLSAEFALGEGTGENLPPRAALTLDPADGSLAIRDEAGELRAQLLRDNEVSRSLRDAPK